MNRREFLKTGLGAAGLVGGGPLLPWVRGQGRTGAPAKPLNILLLMSDQHRFDCVGASGNRVIYTPHLDRLAREGARFRCAYSSTPTCTPARSALLTGLSPWHHGMLGYGRVADRYPVELPRCLTNAGYTTLGVGKMHWYPQRNRHGFMRTILDESGRVETPGFVSDYHLWFYKHASPGMTPDQTGLGWNDYRARPYALPEDLHPTHWIGQTAVDFIENYSGTAPFFLKASFERPHSPYDPPQRFLDAYLEDEMPPAYLGNWDRVHAIHYRHPPHALWQGDLGPDQVRRSRRGYYGSISFVDEQMGRIVAALEKRGWLEQTFILFIADHGDMQGDHYLWRKSYAYEGSAHIPMLCRIPAAMGLPRGQVIDSVVELRDVLPTFLDVAGQPIPPHLDGCSLLGLLRGDRKNWRPWIGVEHNICYSPTNHYNAITDGRIKYIYHAQHGAEQLFDLGEDPHEIHDFSRDPERRPLRREWRHRLVELLAERGAPFVVNGDLAPRPKGMLYSPYYPGWRAR